MMYKPDGQKARIENELLVFSYLQKYLNDDTIACLQFPIDDTIHFHLMVRHDAMMAASGSFIFRAILISHDLNFAY